MGEYIPQRRTAQPYPPVKTQAHRRTNYKVCVSGETKLFCALVLLLIITGVGLIGMYGRVVAINYQVEKVNKEISQLLSEKEYLTIEVRKLSSLERIEHIALTELGLQYPEKRQWLLLSSREKISENPR